MENVTSIECAECGAVEGEWCHDWEARYTLPPYDYRKVIRPGALLAHPVRRRSTTGEAL